MWNIYPVYSDGDNWSEENKAITALKSFNKQYGGYAGYPSTYQLQCIRFSKEVTNKNFICGARKRKFMGCIKTMLSKELGESSHGISVRELEKWNKIIEQKATELDLILSSEFEIID